MATRSRQGLTWALRPTQQLWKLGDALRQHKQKRQLTPEQALGKRGEDLAHRYLQNAGFQVVARNYKPGADSEIDIVARQGDLAIFVEVKTRASSEFSAPERAVDDEKERHIVRAARAYTTRARIDWSCVRFDLISIVMTSPPSIAHYEDAFFHDRVR
jgi:putative endonuclease